MELLNALRNVRVLWVPPEHCRLIQVLAAVLHPVDLHADPERVLLHISVRPETHWLCRSDLIAASAGIVWVLLVERDCLVYVGLHNLVVLLLSTCKHALVASLSGVSDALDCLTLCRRLQTVGVLQSHGRCCAAERRVGLREARIVDVLVVLNFPPGFLKVGELRGAIELHGAPWQRAIRSLRLISLVFGRSCIGEQ